jgi:outer membrane protein assembly factor BamA
MQQSLAGGLDELRKLYGTWGYVDMAANPVVMTDESRRIIDLALEVDEGRAYDFGKLYLEGVESHPGAVRAVIPKVSQFGIGSNRSRA